MLLDLRERVRSSKPIKYTLITIICIPFALVGIGSYFSGGELAPIATVGDQPISLQELDRAKQIQRAQLRQNFGGTLPPTISDEFIEERALDELLVAQAVRNVVDEQNFQVSDITLARAIQSNPAFQTDGVFDKALYERQLGQRAPQYEAQLRESSRTEQLRLGIIASAFVLPQEQERLEQLATQVRFADTVRFAAESVRESVDVSTEEVAAYFEENSDSYVFPQRVKLQYVHLSTDVLMEDIDVSDEEAQAYYDSNRGQYLAPEERIASHILLETDGDADAKIAELVAIKERIEAGEDFGDLAKEFSADIGSAENGGSLGQFARGAMVPEFDDVVFSMTEPGSISDPVVTDFGVHLIRLDEIVAESGRAFDTVKEEVIDTIRRTEANREYGELLEILTDEAFNNPESLDIAAEAIGRDAITTDWIDGTDNSDPVLSNPLILATALSDDVLVNGNNSEAVTIGDNNVVFLRTLEHEDERPKTLDDVREEVTTEVTDQKVADILSASVKALRDRLEAGEALEASAEAEGGDLVMNRFFARTSGDFNRAAINELFRMPKPVNDQPVYGELTLSSGDAVLVVLREILSADEAISREEALIATTESEASGDTAETSGEDTAESTVAAADEGAAADDEEPPFVAFSPQLGNAEFSLLMQKIRDSAEVSIDRAAMQQDVNYGGAY